MSTPMMFSLRPLALSVVAALTLTACAVGPDYQRPDSHLPAAFASGATAAETASVNPQWWTLFNDPLLTELVDSALQYNSDVQLAVARVEEADALLRQAGAALFPQFDLTASDTRNRVSTTTSLPGASPLVRESLKTNLGTSFELDVWGRLRRAKELTAASALANRYSRDTVMLSVAGLVSQSYIALRSLDAQVAASQSSLETRTKSLALVQARFAQGLASALELRQAEGAKAAIVSQTADLVQSRALAQHQLALLTGRMDLHVPASTLDNLPLPPVPPAGLPSSLLEARPDVRQAEQQLVAANAKIGVAKASLFPTMSLTAGLGGESDQLAKLFSSSSRIWTAGFGLSLPIFDAGLRAAQVEQATAQQKQALISYQKAVQSAFKDVNDALVSLRQTAEKDLATTEQVSAAQQALKLAELRYQAGYSPYLETLDAQRTLNDATLSALKNRQARLAAAVDLFKALGGGWQARP